LDTKRSLDGVLVQINLPSQTQTSRQIAWVNVIGITSAHKKEEEEEDEEEKGKKKKKKFSPQQTSSVLAYIFSLLTCEKC